MLFLELIIVRIKQNLLAQSEFVFRLPIVSLSVNFFIFIVFSGTWTRVNVNQTWLWVSLSRGYFKSLYKLILTLFSKRR